MPAGLPYFAWIDPTETVFNSGHLRWDEQLFSFKLEQNEGDYASLTVVVRRPRNTAGDPIGLLGPGRKIWCWFALDCDGSNLVKFRGRLVGVPTSLFQDLVTLEFVAKPIDVVAQKNALANTLRVLPWYDATLIDPSKRTDPDTVLEAYTVIWHYDRETHVVTVSDEISGEDGLVEFDGASDTGKVLYDGLALSLTSGPLARVDVVDAEFTWTQTAGGGIDLTDYIRSNWPKQDNGLLVGLAPDSFPKTGTSIGDGWVAVEASGNAYGAGVGSFKVNTVTGSSSLKIKDDFDTSTVNISWSTQATVERGTGEQPAAAISPSGPPFIQRPSFQKQITLAASSDQLPNLTPTYKDTFNQVYSLADGVYYLSSLQRNVSQTIPKYMYYGFEPLLVAGYTAGRPFTESVSFTLFADVQPILTDPEDGEALRIDNIKSVNLSEYLDAADGVPIGDSRRRSYIATPRGNRSLEYLILLARANLMKRARVVEIAFAPKLARMPEITLRKNVAILEPRIGEAVGKIINYSIELDGSNGTMKCEIKIGCTIGRGGSVVEADGVPTYCEAAYTGPDYQQYTERFVLIGSDTSVGYEPPQADPNDDGINFLSSMNVADIIDQPLSVLFEETKTTATFKLKSMSKDFTTPYILQVTNLKIPTGYNLEAT